MMTRTTPEQELAAWIFVKWFTSPEIQAEWDQISGYFPTRAGTAEYLGDYRRPRNRSAARRWNCCPTATTNRS